MLANVGSTFGSGSDVQNLLSTLGSGLFGTKATGEGGPASELSLGDIGFIIHEVVKFIKAMENFFKAFKPSAEAGTGFLNVDIEISFGEIISALAELLDIVAQILIFLGGKQSSAELKQKLQEITEGIEKLETKSDRQEIKLDLIMRDLGWIMSEVDDLAGLLGESIVGTPWIVDPRRTRTGNPVPDRSVKEELHDIEDKVDRLEEKDDRQEEKLDRQEEKLDRVEEKLDREEEKLDRFVMPAPPHEGTVAQQRGTHTRLSAAMSALRTGDDRAYLRFAIDVPRAALGDESSWIPWVSFGRPPAAARLVSVSVDVSYEDESDTLISGLLSVRDAAGLVFHRNFEGSGHRGLPDPAEWSEWHEFLRAP